MNTIQGREEVQEAVLIAGLSAIVTGLIHWGIDMFRERAKARNQEATCQDLSYPSSTVTHHRRSPARQPERE